jgi:membrane protein implicated in regulation of membrane protease activity
MKDLLNVSAGHDDALSLSMFWAGALMVFAPIVFASIVLGVWWYQRRHAPTEDDPASANPPVL